MNATVATVSWRVPWAALALAVTGLAAVVRLGVLDSHSLWLDEYLWSRLSRRPYETIFWTADGYPPLVAWILRILMEAGFTSDFALRLPSALAGISCVPVLYHVGRRVSDPLVGLVAALLLALNPLAVWYSIEAGAYAILMLAALIGTWALLGLQRTGGRAYAGIFAASALVGLGVHYYFGLVLMTQAGFALADFAARPERRRAYLECAGLTIVAGLVWVAPLYGDILLQAEVDQNRGMAFMALPYTAFTFVGGFSLGPPLRELHAAQSSANGSWQIISPHLLVIVAAVGSLTILGLLALPTIRNRAGALVLGLAVGPPLLAWAASAVLVGYRPRYAIAALPFALLLAALATRSRHRLPARTLLVVLVSLELAGLAMLSEPDYAREDTRGAAEILLDHEPAPILLVGQTAAPLQRYVREGSALYLYPADLEEPNAIDSVAAPHLAGAESVWLVESRPWTVDPEGRTEEYLARDFELEETHQTAGVRVLRFKRRGP